MDSRGGHRAGVCRRYCSANNAAGAVLLSAIGAAIVGVLVFWPHLAPLLARLR
jgi:hypothetical protein